MSLCAYLASYLDPIHLANLLATASYGTGDSERAEVWRLYFVQHCGADLRGFADTAKVRVMLSWTAEEEQSASWPLTTVGFWGASSAIDHVFWLLPFLRCAFRIEPMQPELGPSPTKAWQLCARLATGSSRERICRCFICNVLEILPPAPCKQHFRQRWVRPCAECLRPAHRSCLEKLLHEHEPFHWRVGVNSPTCSRSTRRRRSGSSSCSCASGGQQRKAQIQHKSGHLSIDANSGSPMPELRCAQCGSAYWTSKRFPENVPELLKATFQEWRWVLKRCFAIFVLFMWMEMITMHYLGLESISNELCILLLFTAGIMSVSVAPRFHRGVQMIWNTPHRWRYLQLFGFYAVLVYLVSVLRIIEPSMWKGAVQQWRWLSIVYSVCLHLHSSAFGPILLSSISVCYVLAASGIMFLFWKTSLRVPTVADAVLEPLSGTMSPSLEASRECGLCQLGLCLDNPCM